MDDDHPQDARLCFEQDMSEAHFDPLAGGTVALFSTRSPAKQTPNEDAAAWIRFDEQSAVLVVADGLGGPPGGEQAASLAIRALQDAIKEGIRGQLMLRTAILNGFERANRAVLEWGVGGATTLAVVELQPGSVRPYHAGDSMILVVGRRGRIKLQTTSHSPVGFAVQAGWLDEQEAMHHEDRHLVSNVIGSDQMRIEIGPTVKLALHDTVLLASDGLFDNLHVEEVVERIRKGPLAEAARRLAADASQRMRAAEPGQPSKPDDLTFLAFRPTAPK